MWMLGTKSGPPQEQRVLLTTSHLSSPSVGTLCCLGFIFIPKKFSLDKDLLCPTGWPLTLILFASASLHPECWHYRCGPPCSAFCLKHCCAYAVLFLPTHGCFYLNIVKRIAEYSFKRHIEDWSVWKDILQFPPATSTVPFSLFCISLRF